MLSIGEFSKICNVTTKTLRYYDKIGLLKPVQVDQSSGYRYYDVFQLKTMLLIDKLKSYQFTLEEISEILNNENKESLSSLIKGKEKQVLERIDYFEFILKQMQQDILNLERGIPIMAYLDNIEIKLVETKPQNILSIRKKMNIADFGKYLGKLYGTIAKENLTPTGPPISIYYDEEFKPENYDMEIAIPVKEVVTGTRDFSGTLCASATLKGPYSELSSVYAKLKQWMDAEGFVPNGAPFDYYVTSPQDTKPEDFITYVHFPVKKK